MKPKKIAVSYDCGRDYLRNLETRISFVNDPLLHECRITACTLTKDGETTGLACMDVTPEIAEEICEILNNKEQ